MKNLIQSTAVLTANTFNIPIFQQVWLIDNGIFSKEDFAGQTLFSPLAINIPHNNYEFLAIPERVQVRILQEQENAKDTFRRIIVGIAKALPHTPFQALGLNFEVLVYSEDKESFQKNIRNTFMPSIPALSSILSNGDERFGSYISQDIFDCRVKIDIKPVIHEGIDKLLLVFNFHKNIETHEDIAKLVDTWDDLRVYVDNFSDILSGSLES